MEVDFADAMGRYGCSYDEMRTVRLNPLKIIPVDQWPEETRLQGSAVVRIRDWKRYVRYVLRVASENERLAAQARSWWAWWERAQVEPSKAGPAPLVSPNVEEALRIAAAGRMRRWHCSAEELPRWEHLGPHHQAIIRWLLQQERGEVFTRSEVLDKAPGVHNKGTDRKVLDDLIEIRVLEQVEGKRSQLRLFRRPDGVPESIERHLSWRDPSNES